MLFFLNPNIHCLKCVNFKTQKYKKHSKENKFIEEKFENIKLLQLTYHIIAGLSSVISKTNKSPSRHSQVAVCEALSYA